MMPSVPSDADEEILQRIAGDVLHAFVAEARHLAVGEHDFEAHHVVARDAVLEPAQPAGVLGDVAADRADPLRAGIGRIEQAVPRRRLVDALGDGAGCARSVRLRGSTSRIASICVRQRTRQPGLGTLPPLRPVPDPRVTIGVPLAAASRTHSATCAVVRGKTTADGRTFNAAVPSKLYGIEILRRASAPRRRRRWR